MTMNNDTPDILDTPSTKPFQFNGQADGSVGQDVNQFQGAVSFSVPVVSLPGRSGLNMDVAAVYNSSVADVVTRSNLDAPTGVLGLGWDLLVDRIEAGYATPGNRDGATFFLVSRGNRSRLYWTGRTWQRGQLAASFAPALNAGTLPTTLLTALLQQTLVVAATASVQVIEVDQRWQITDPVNEDLLVIQVDPSNNQNLLVLDGGVGYQPESFNFARIRYYAAFERWEMFSASGSCCVFGGGVRVDSSGNHTSRGESITWGVKWGNWSGPSTVAGEGRPVQSQYPLSWRISSERAVNRDELMYAYQQTQQRVGPSGLNYTKAVYLSVITDMFGRTATFDYDDKEFDPAPAGSREYLDPYKPVPDDVPDAYQSRYEARYLKSVSCRTRDGQTLSVTRFDFDLELFCPVPGNAPPSFAGDRAKRILTSISRIDDQGSGLPPMLLSYHGVTEINPGALATKVQPEGATTLYAYQQKSLAVCSRTLDITPPLASATPKIWFGPDYAVVVWLARDRFDVVLYTWSGRWIQWRPSTSTYLFPGDPTDLTADVQDDFVVLSLGNTNGLQSMILCFHRNNRVLGGWLESPNLPLLLPTVDRDIAAGRGFFAVANGQDNTVDRYTWSNTKRQWQKLALPTPPRFQDPASGCIFLTGDANLLVALYYDRLSSPGNKQSLLNLNFLDQSGAWQAGDSRVAGELTITGSTTADLRQNFQWSPSPWVFAATAVTRVDNSNLAYQITLYTWGDSYAWEPPFQQDCSMNLSSTGARAYIPTAVVQATGLVTSGPYLLRYNGSDWLLNENLALQLPPSDDTVFWFAQGQDIVLKTENSAGQIIGMAQVFDPNEDSGSWVEAPITFYNGPPADSRFTNYFPTAGSDFISFGTTLFYRGTSSDWVEPVQRPIPALPAGSNTTTLINESPEFMVYLQQSNGRPLQTNMLLLSSGFVGATEPVLQNFYCSIDADGHVDPDSNGSEPAGPGSFVTFLPLSGTFAEAQSLTLYRFLNGSITLPVMDFPVSSVTVDDGYSRKQYVYDFDASTSAINPEGYSCKYYTSTVTVGDGSLCGSTSFTFINGVGGQSPGNPVQDALLDGQLQRKELFDSRKVLVSSQDNVWQPITQILDPQTGEPVALDGAFVQLSRTVNTVNGIASPQDFTYDPASGQAVATTTTVWNALGQEETRTRSIVLAYSQDPLFGYLNILDEQAGSSSTIATGGGPAVVSAQQSVRFRLFDGIAMGAAGSLQLLSPWQSYVRKAAGTGTPGSAPQEWQLQQQINACNPYGYPIEAVDASGLIASSLYAAENSPLVATFAGASILGQEAYYFGFEPYETPGRWALDPQVTPVVSTICNTGTQCLSLPAAVTGASLLLTPQDRSEVFLFAFWGALDPAAGGPPPATAWRIEFSSSDPATLPPSQTISVTSTDWTYYCAAIDLRASTVPVTVHLTPLNSGSSTIYVDNVCFFKLMGGARAKVFDPVNFLVTAEVGPHNEITRRVYDRADREIAYTSEFQAVQRVIAPYLSRQTQPAFDAAVPNSQLAFQPMGQAVYDRFLNNGVWSDHFSSPAPAQWQSRAGSLRYTGGPGGSISFSQPVYNSNYAWRCDVGASDASFSVGFGIGAALTVRWQPASRKWLLADAAAGISIESTVTSASPDGDWMVISGTGALLFAVNGFVLFDYVPATMPTGQPAILTDGPIALRGFLIGGQPQIGVRYFDGVSKSLQGQSIEGASAVVAALVHDPAGRPMVKVKPVTYRATVGTVKTLLVFRTDVVTSFNWTTGVLTGEAATQYPDDGGYPYVRQTVEMSPLARTLQAGAPGALFAITNTDPAAQHTIRSDYGNNTDATINSALGLPAQKYVRVTTTDQDGRVSVDLRDTIGQPVATATLLDASSRSWLLSLQSTVYTPDGSQRTVRVPNYYAPPTGSTPSAWVNVTRRDLLGLSTSSTTPDGATTTTITDHLGRIRFVQDALAASLGVVLYTKYDRYGRQLEAGLVPAAWDVPRLLDLANQPAWPTPTDGARIIRTNQYGSDPAKVNNLGRIVLATSYDGVSGLPTTSNTTEFDATGQIMISGVRFEQDGTSRTTAYTYDNLGNSVTTMYDSGYSVVTERDPVGRVSRILDGNRQLLATYRYSPGDQIIEQAILPGSTGQTTLTYSYAPPGWLQSISSPCMTSTLSYTTGSYNGTPYYSGRPGSVQTSFQNLASPDPGFISALKYAYQYDPRGQLQVAQALVGGTPRPDLSFGLGATTDYDANGNFLTVSDGTTVQRYKYTANTNRVINTTGGSQIDYESNAIGAITRSVPQRLASIKYDLSTQQALSIDTELEGQLRFQYDSRSNRVQKTAGTVTVTYARSINGWPLVERRTDAATGQTTVTEYLYGPRGLFAIRVGGVVLPVLTDHLNSVRGLVDPTGKLQVAFHYSPFGNVVAQYGDAAALRYRFTGYEYDRETGLYNAAARLYDPALKRFYSVDPQMQFYSPYLYVGNNPVSALDPTGESAAWWALLVGAVVGIIATVATGGALAPAVAGLEGAAALAATVGVGAVAGAVGTVAGDATTAGLAGEKFTAMRALVDIAGGAAGGGVGALVGAPAASLAMRGALAVSEEVSAKVVTTIGTITAGVVGGTAGATAQSAVTSAMTGQAFFSADTALNIAIGGAAGFGGSLLGSGAHLGWGGDTMPVPLGRSDFPLIRQNVYQGDTGTNSLTTFNYQRLIYAGDENMYRLNPQSAASHDVVNMHGSPGMTYVTILRPSGVHYERPLSPRLLAEFLQSDAAHLNARNGTIKLAICYGAKGGWFSKSAGQTLATALGRDVYGAKGVTYSPSGSPDNQWVRFTP